jgi:hypothetical protein
VGALVRRALGLRRDVLVVGGFGLGGPLRTFRGVRHHLSISHTKPILAGSKTLFSRKKDGTDRKRRG